MADRLLTRAYGVVEIRLYIERPLGRKLFAWPTTGFHGIPALPDFRSGFSDQQVLGARHKLASLQKEAEG